MSLRVGGDCKANSISKLNMATFVTCTSDELDEKYQKELGRRTQLAMPDSAALNALALAIAARRALALALATAVTLRTIVLQVS